MSHEQTEPVEQIAERIKGNEQLSKPPEAHSGNFRFQEEWELLENIVAWPLEMLSNIVRDSFETSSS